MRARAAISRPPARPGLRTAVVSAGAYTGLIVERAGLAAVIEQEVDGYRIMAEQLRVRPAGDPAACRLLGVPAESAAAFETSPDGIAAARALGFRLVLDESPRRRSRPE